MRSAKASHSIHGSWSEVESDVHNVKLGIVGTNWRSCYGSIILIDNAYNNRHRWLLHGGPGRIRT